jgi:predicted secreted protein
MRVADSLRAVGLAGLGARSPRRVAAALAVAVSLGGIAARPAAAQGPALAPLNQLSLSASASVEVTMDTLALTFSTNGEGADAAALQGQLKRALDAALAEARKVARPGQIDVRTGNFSLYPRYTAKGVSNGWRGSAELQVEGRDTQGIAQLAGRIATMNIASADYALSREARDRLEAEVGAQAIASFRARADAMSRQFGFTGYTLREVQVGGNGPPRFAPAPMLRAQAAMASADAALPVEAGKTTVSVTVSGTVQMQ